MKVNYIKNISYAFCITAIMGLSGCETYPDHEPGDLVTGKVDLEWEDAKSKFINPAKLSGTVVDKLTQSPIVGAKLTVKSYTTHQSVSRTSGEDGKFNLYVEGGNDYVIFAEYDGYDKCYLFTTDYYNTGIDTLTAVPSGESQISLKLVPHDPTPLLSVNYLITRYTSESYEDISFNGTNLLAMDYYGTVDQYTLSGTFLKTTYTPAYSNFLAYQDTSYWIGNSSSRTLGKYGQKGGEFIKSIFCQIPYSDLVGIDVFSNNFYLITASQIYKVSATGELLLTIDLSRKVTDLNLIGITHKDNYLYVLNKEDDEGNFHKGHSIYKLDPATGNIIAKGYLPADLNKHELTGLTTDSNNFWALESSGYYNNLVKFSVQ